MFGKKFKIRAEHKALTTIVGPKTGIATLAAKRLQRWAMFLTAHDYEVELRPTNKHGNADCLSRLPLHTNCTTSAKPTVNTLQIGSMPVTAEHLKRATQSDPVLSKVLNYTLKGWPVQVTPDLQPFFTRQHEITAQDGCLLWACNDVIDVIVEQQVDGQNDNTGEPTVEQRYPTRCMRAPERYGYDKDGEVAIL